MEYRGGGGGPWLGPVQARHEAKVKHKEGGELQAASEKRPFCKLEVQPRVAGLCSRKCFTLITNNCL